MRTLMINSNRFKQPWPVMPFGLGCVAAAVEQAGHPVRVLDLCFSDDPAAEIRRALGEFKPEVVGISVRNIDNSAGYNTLFFLEEVRRDVMEPCKKAFGGPIVIGGPSVGINGAEMLEFFDLELAVRGDGEAAMIELLRRLEGKSTLAGMPGLVRRVNGRIVDDNAPMPVQDLDALPMDRVYDHIDVAGYQRYGSALQIQTKRGCALSCSYCTYNRIEGRRWRLRSPQRVADDIERLVRQTGVRHVEFTDSTFNYPLEHCKAVLRAVEAKGLDLRLRTMGLNPGAVDEELVDLMHRTGFREVDLGAESLCDATLRGLGKNFRKADVLRAARLLEDRKIAVMWYLLLGGPGETPETARETLVAAREAAQPWDLVNVGIGLRIYKGAPVADSVQMPDNLLRPVCYAPAGLSLEQLKLIVKREALTRYNYFMYDEDETTPLIVQRFGTWVVKHFAPGQPVWRIFIVMRRLQKWSGIGVVRRAAWTMKHRKELVELDGQMAEPVSRERIGNFLAGASVLLTAGLALVHSPYWLLGTLAIACNLLVTSVINRCVIKSLLIRMGLPGEWDLGRMDALKRLEQRELSGIPGARALMNSHLSGAFLSLPVGGRAAVGQAAMAQAGMSAKEPVRCPELN